MRYYIYADDFGILKSKTKAIDDGFSKGWIHSATMVVNGEDYDEAVALAEQHHYKDRIAFHLNLTRGYPLTEAVKRTALCKGDGSFATLRNPTIQRRCMTIGAIRAIRAECEAQMKLFRERGFTSQHIDSHRWCMWNIPVWFAIRPLLKRYGFVTTRTKNGHLLDTSGKMLRVYYRMLSLLMCPLLKEKTDWSGCMSEFQEAMRNRRVDSRTYAEIYVHPDFRDGVSIDTYYSYHEKRPLEEVIKMTKDYGSP